MAGIGIDIEDLGTMCGDFSRGLNFNRFKPTTSKKEDEGVS